MRLPMAVLDRVTLRKRRATRYTTSYTFKEGCEAGGAFNRAFSTLIPRVFEMGLETHDASEALAARQCWMDRASCQFG